MNARCLSCGLHHTRRVDGQCPRCGAPPDQAPKSATERVLSTAIDAAGNAGDVQPDARIVAAKVAIKLATGDVLGAARVARNEKSLGRDIEDRAYAAEGLDRRALNQASKERWIKRPLSVALREDLAQMRAEWWAKRYILIVFLSVVTIIGLIFTRFLWMPIFGLRS